MGAKRREMGPGWLMVDAAHLADGASLLSWLDTARDFHRSRGD